MKLDEFMSYDGFHIVFPKYQDEKIRKFADRIDKLIGSDAIIIRRATYDPHQRNLKDKDILFIELKNTIKGIFGVLLCLHEFESFIELRVIKDMIKFEIPKEIRDYDDEYYEFFDEFENKFKNLLNIDELELKDINSNLFFELKNLIKR
ncbi:MAG: hypothetical protein ACFFCV_18810 [Promethearchaeota archaeon]